MKKTFECVMLKDGIQQRMLKQMEGLSGVQQRAAIRNSLEKSRSPIGELWRALERRSAAPAEHVAEADGSYGGVWRDRNPDRTEDD